MRTTPGIRNKLEAADPVTVVFPDWIGGGDPAFLSRLCGWQTTRVGEKWSVQTRETVRGARPGLLTLRSFGSVSAYQTEERYAAVRELEGYDRLHPSDGWQPALALDRRIATRADATPAQLIGAARALITAAPNAAQLLAVLPSIAEERLRPVVPAASVWQLRTHDQLAARYSVARAMLRERPDPTSGDAATRNLTRASAELFPETSHGLTAYIAPLFSCLSPWVWGTTAVRAGAVFLLPFGGLIPGEDGSAGHLLRTLRSEQSDFGYDAEAPSTDQLEAATRWWMRRLDLLFGEATNLFNYAAGGVFSAPRMVEKLLNLEQCFRHCQSLSTTSADDHTRRMMTFIALEGFGGVSAKLNWSKTYSLPVATGMLEDLHHQLPAKVAAVLLPRAQRGVEALREVQDGFFDCTRTNSDTITLVNKQGSREAVPLHTAAKLWLRVLRNSHHGFDQEPTPRERDLLALHDGRFPPALGDLPWLVLLYLLTFPEVMRRPTPKMRSPQ